MKATDISMANSLKSHPPVILNFISGISSTPKSDSNELVHKIRGYIDVKSLIYLIRALPLEANPRNSKNNNIVNDIIETLSSTPNLFHDMSHGILISSEFIEYQKSDKNSSNVRVKLHFESRHKAPNDEEYDGILDGGHTLLAIARYIIMRVFGEESSEFKRNKKWSKIKDLWISEMDRIKDYVESNSNEFNFKLHATVYHASPYDQYGTNYINSIYDIASARNTNTQLDQGSIDNKDKVYDLLKTKLSENTKYGDFTENVVCYRANEENKRLKVADIVALSLIPLSKCDTGDITYPHTVIYNGKKRSSTEFRDIMKLYSNMESREQRFIDSALELVPELLYAYDYIYHNLPKAIAKARMTPASVLNCNKSVGKYKTKYTEKSTDYKYPHAFIMPLVSTLSINIKRTRSKVTWKTPVIEYIDTLLSDSNFITLYVNTFRNDNASDYNKFAKTNTNYGHIRSAVFELID